MCGIKELGLWHNQRTLCYMATVRKAAQVHLAHLYGISDGEERKAVLKRRCVQVSSPARPSGSGTAKDADSVLQRAVASSCSRSKRSSAASPEALAVFSLNLLIPVCFHLYAGSVICSLLADYWDWHYSSKLFRGLARGIRIRAKNTSLS